jgi:hypothetical protein
VRIGAPSNRFFANPVREIEMTSAPQILARFERGLAILTHA